MSRPGGAGRTFRRIPGRAPLLPTVYLVMVAVIFVLPFYSVAEYSPVRHSISELGAQGAPHAWVMNSVFILLGLASVIDGWPLLPGLWFHRTALAVFGASLVLVGIFQHAPVPAEGPYSVREDDLHSTFSGLVGGSFIALTVATAFGGARVWNRSLGPAVGAFAGLMSLLIFAVPDYAGVWQRLLFCLCFGWLTLFLAEHRNAGGTAPT